MSAFVDLLVSTAEITFPIFILVTLGWGLKNAGWLSAGFIETGTQLVFLLGLPALLFLKVSAADLDHVLNSTQLGYAMLSTCAVVVALWYLTGRLNLPPKNRGVFVQGAFRGNMGIIGLALCANMYGETGLAIGSILLAFLTLLYNVLSVWALSASHKVVGTSLVQTTLLGLLKNPLILAILAGIAVNQLQWPLPKVLITSGGYLADLTLPLALLCIGGSINLKSLQSCGALAVYAGGLKLIILPAIMTAGAYTIGLDGVLLGTLFLMFASPSATVGFVMAKAMRGNAELAATIITLTTAVSIFTISLGIFILQWAGVA